MQTVFTFRFIHADSASLNDGRRIGYYLLFTMRPCCRFSSLLLVSSGVYSSRKIVCCSHRALCMMHIKYSIFLFLLIIHNVRENAMA